MTMKEWLWIAIGVALGVLLAGAIGSLAPSPRGPVSDGGIQEVQVEQVHLGWATNDVYRTMTVMWFSDVPDDAKQRVVYSTSRHPGEVTEAEARELYESAVIGSAEVIQPTMAPDGSSITTTAFEGLYCTAEIRNLEPGTRYFFRVLDGLGGATSEWWFQTIALDQEVTFAFGGDSRRPYEDAGVPFAELRGKPDAAANWPQMRDFITSGAAAKNPDFMLFLGDFVNNGDSQSQWSHWLNAWQENAVSPAARMIPIVPVIGNHEMGTHPDVNSSYEWCMRQFAMPGEDPWFALDFPNLHLTVLAATFRQVSSGNAWSKAEAEIEAQQAWLEADLSSEAATGAAWQLVAFHANYFGCYVSGTGYPSDAYLQAWTKLFQDSGVDLVMMGHTHNYTRSWPIVLSEDDIAATRIRDENLTGDSTEGITYITHGSWGAPPNPLVAGTSCQVRSWIVSAAGHPVIATATVKTTASGEDRLTIRVENTRGDRIDTFVLPFSRESLSTPRYEEVIR